MGRDLNFERPRKPWPCQARALRPDVQQVFNTDIFTIPFPRRAYRGPARKCSGHDGGPAHWFNFTGTFNTGIGPTFVDALLPFKIMLLAIRMRDSGLVEIHEQFLRGS